MKHVKMFDHFSFACRANMSQMVQRYSPPRSHGHHQKKRVMKDEETYPAVKVQTMNF